MSTRKACIVCSQEFTGDDTICPSDGTILTPLLTDRYVGTVLAGRYEVQEIIGGGGMGLVYKARHTMMNRIVAIKMLHSHLTTSAETLKRFQLEAQAASCLSLPNILTIYDFGVTDEGQPYMVMDYLEGTSLADVLENEVRVTPLRGLHIFIQCCAGLAHAHQKGVIHRDLKPSNIMLVNYGDQVDFVKIVDFGIAKLLNRVEGGSANLTRTGEVYGSPLYMSPEQCRGHELDARSDIYSFGCVMYKTLTGSPIFAGTEMIELLFKQVSEQPKPFAEICPDAEIPEELERITFKVLSKDMASRFQSMDELKETLENLKARLEGRGGAEIITAPAPTPEPAGVGGRGASSHNIPAGPLATAMAQRSHTSEHPNPVAPAAPVAPHTGPGAGAAAAASAAAATAADTPFSRPAAENPSKLSGPQQAPVMPAEHESNSNGGNGNSNAAAARAAASSAPPIALEPAPDRFDRLRPKDEKPDWGNLIATIFHHRVAQVALASVIIGAITVAIMIATTMPAPHTVLPPGQTTTQTGTVDTSTSTSTSTTPPDTTTQTGTSTATTPESTTTTSTATGAHSATTTGTAGTTTSTATTPPQHRPRSMPTTTSTHTATAAHTTATSTTTAAHTTAAGTTGGSHTATTTSTTPVAHATQAAHHAPPKHSPAHASSGGGGHHRRHAYSSYGY